MWKKTRVMFLAATLSTGTALADDSGSRQKGQQEEPTYDESRMRPKEAAAAGEGSGRSAPYDDRKMEPGEVTGAKPDAGGQREPVDYDDTRMKPAEK